MKMKENELKGEREGTTVSGAVGRWLSMYTNGIPSEKTRGRSHADAERGKQTLIGALCFIVGGLVAMAGVGGLYPFGLSLISGCEKKMPFFALGAIASYWIVGDRMYAVAGALILVLRLTVGLALDGRRGISFSEPMSLRMAIGAAGGFVTGIYLIFSGGFKDHLLYEAIFLIIAVPFFALALSGAVSRQRVDERRLGVSLILTYALLLSGLGRISFVGFSPALAVASVLTLCTAMTGGAIRGALVGMLGALSFGGSAAAVGVLGAVSGCFKRRGALPSALAGCTAAAVTSLLLDGKGAIYGVPAIIWGGAVCLMLNRASLVPSLSVIRTRRVSAREGESLMSEKREAQMSLRLQSLSEAMTGLSGVFYALSNRLGSPDSYRVRELCRDSFKKYCGGCPSANKCWGRDIERTADVMNKLSEAVIKHGNADSSYVPKDFLTVCPHAMKALSEVNLSHARLLEEAARQNKTEVFALDYEAMARLLTEASEENSAEYELDSRLSEAARRVGVALNMGFNSISVYGKRKKTVIAGGVELDRVKKTGSELQRAFSDACGVELTPPEFKLDDGYTVMTMTSRRIISLESARASSKKKDESVNGDSAAVFENREERFYALISDGMGSGEEASLTSKMTAVFLEKLLSAGNRRATVLKMLNNFIRHKNLECFATVDLLEIDTLTAEATFVKSGAAASYVIRDGRLFRIASSSLPIGITREMVSEEVKLEVRPNDLIIMISDGVSQSFEDGNWLLSMLSEELDVSAPLNHIAKSILDAAKKNNGRSDDMTVLAVRVEGE